MTARPTSPESTEPTPRTSGPSQRVREEHVTSTGWRLVGRAASMVSGDAASAGLEAGRDEDVLFAAKFRLKPRLGNASPVNEVLRVLGLAIAREWEGAPPLTRERPVTRTAARFHGLSWSPEGDNGAWRAELLWRHKHPVIAGTPCTTHVIILEQHTQTLLSVRVTADGGLASVRGAVGAGQARPSFLTELNRSLRLVFDGEDGSPRALDEEGIEEFVRDVLLSETREHPVAVITPVEGGGYLVPPAQLAEELLGLAHLHVIDRHPSTFRLSDALGDRRLSAYWGALRVYMPGFSCADRPEDHPLLVRDRVIDPVIRAELIGRLGRFAGTRMQSPGPAGLAAAAPIPVIVPVAVPAAPTPATPVTAVSSTDVARPEQGATMALAAELTPLLSGLMQQIGALASTIAHLVEANSALSDEIARLRTTTAVRAANTTSLERRLGGVEELLRQQYGPPISSEVVAAAASDAIADAAEDEEESGTPSLVEALRQAAVAHSDALLILDNAESAAADSPYQDVERLAVILDAMAAVARRRQEGALGTALKTAFRELGIDYRGGITANTSGKMLQQYLVKGAGEQLFECREHIVLGTSHDPRHTLRIYFTSRAPIEPRFVIGHVGRHFDVASTT